MGCPITFQDAFKELESEIYDVRNMAAMAADIVDEDGDRDLLSFAVCHTASLANDLRDKWTRLHDEASRQKETAQ